MFAYNSSSVFAVDYSVFLNAKVLKFIVIMSFSIFTISVTFFLLIVKVYPNTTSKLHNIQWLPDNCNNSNNCSSQAINNSVCKNDRCECIEGYYLVKDEGNSSKSYCAKCSLFQESCVVTQCCQMPHANECLNGVCVCRPNPDEDCLSKYSPTLGVQLANTLSLSFAFVFLAITFVAVIRKTLFNCGFCNCDSISRAGSNSSLNEFIKEKMQNRPPSYDEIEKDRKVPIYINQPPPEYNSLRPGKIEIFRGVINRAFSISDEVDMNMSPPNYSTFTSVSNTTIKPTLTQLAASTNQCSEEVILTRPIYSSSSQQS
ncbi:uncharacterized protein LOC126906114 isoform X2 [Daktulosphaira vitifoliae]|uniref:uncharacterized protein LOC126906114 isoform X2 n=1 Tax=Daktulosphaira vitifoliae TaxID=58002 RepID=UPI0021A9E9E7|nr:uncharacterized protein LOC126906114 isoform X2 [Daktulosphaira vitifoliae]